MVLCKNFGEENSESVCRPSDPKTGCGFYE